MEREKFCTYRGYCEEIAAMETQSSDTQVDGSGLNWLVL